LTASGPETAAATSSGESSDPDGSNAPIDADGGATAPAGRGGVVRSLVRWTPIATAALLLAPLPLVVALRWIDPPASAFMMERALGHERMVDSAARARSAATPRPRRQAGVGAGFVARRLGVDYRWTDLDDIAPAMALAVVAAEDQRFPTHRGFDLDSIRDAVNERDRRARVRGASTITQQVAKNLFLWPGRSFLRKGLEAWLAAAIEVAWPKRRILEIYLNVAELGPDLYGVGAAAPVYFGKPPAALTRRESALLAASLPNPEGRHPDRPSRWLSERASWIETQCDQLGGSTYLAGILAGPAGSR
jgi:monofunctional biosynthetic peptidoglycan transglycosylase